MSNSGFLCRMTTVILFSLLVVSGVSAGSKIVVRDSDQPFDAFKVRDQLLKDHQWQETLRMQEQIQILQSLPLGCAFQLTPYRHYLCRGLVYRPYQYEGKQVYIQTAIPSKLEK